MLHMWCISKWLLPFGAHKLEIQAIIVLLAYEVGKKLMGRAYNP
jgi:hypothetical protein